MRYYYGDLKLNSFFPGLFTYLCCSLKFFQVSDNVKRTEDGACHTEKIKCRLLISLLQNSISRSY
uniref:Uncharacterized protein n=1 Tax=Arundo donax TaxID=35708 RepID=A0A0A9FN67_ARUDO